jgi:hypothetical protein
MVGAVALAAGVGVGLLLPVTHKENEVLGPSRDKLLQGAKETVQEFGQAAKDAAQGVSGALSGAV